MGLVVSHLRRNLLLRVSLNNQIIPIKHSTNKIVNHLEYNIYHITFGTYN